MILSKGISGINISSEATVVGGASVDLIIPCWKCEPHILERISEWQSFAGIENILIGAAPGATLPDSLRQLEKVTIITSDRPGRGNQMAAAARHATSDIVLFHHIDSDLTQAHVQAVSEFFSSDTAAVGGAFYRKFDIRHPELRFLEGFERWHCRAFGTLYGDQSIFVRRDHYRTIGGMPEIPLMEDVAFSSKLRKSGPVAILDPPMSTSPRRHLERGAWRTTLRNAWMLLLFRLGASPEKLHATYYQPQPVNHQTAMHQPIRKSTHWQRRWQAFLNPLESEKSEYLNRRWDELPAELQTPNQIAGRHLTHCGFTTGASYCSFHCTHCYLPKNANEVPIPALAQVKEQIRANRNFQGPFGGLQITGGDVADAYFKSGRQDELVEIVRYTYEIGLVPMLMTHGQTLLEHPEFLEQLVVAGGLRQMSVHIDVTQAGRKNYPIRNVKSEADLHPVREDFTELVKRIRRDTGAHLELALSCTVTRKNIGDIPEVIRWYLADPERTHIWRMISFQPEADTGRTIYSEKPITPTDVWEKIREGTGRPVRKDATIFGHPDCNSWAPMMVARTSGKIFSLLPEDPKWDRMMGKLLEKVGGLHLMNDDAGTPFYRLLGVIVRSPLLWLHVMWYGVHCLATGRLPWSVLGAIFRNKVHVVGIGMHNFMDASQVAQKDTDPVIRARLDSCVFKGAVKMDGKWEAVPMCSMNQANWSRIYDERLQDVTLKTQPQVPRAATAQPVAAE